ncbi:MAG: V-type ATPase 116kDa subunit family protein [Bacteroidales bacterium]
MIRYSFLIYHKEYHSFLDKLQDIGVLHIAEKATEYDEDTMKALADIKTINETLRFLKKRSQEENPVDDGMNPMEVVKDIKERKEEIDNIEQELATLRKEIEKAQPWGDFTHEVKDKLQQLNLTPRFFICNEKRFDNEWENQYYIEQINKIRGNIYFVVLQEEGTDLDIDAEETKLPSKPYSELDKEYDDKEKRIKEINKLFDEYAVKYQEALRKEREKLQHQTDFNQALNHTEKQAEEKVMLLEGWVPEPNEKELLGFLEKENVLFLKGEKKDEKPYEVPVLLKNNKFAKVYEPLQELFSLPHYKEIDLTPFFAPFFMLFFGFCLGDAGYGIAILLGVTFFKHTKAKPSIKPYLTMAQYLGAATVLMGAVGGTVFGLDLTELDYMNEFHSMFLQPQELFNLSLALGMIQILFGMVIKAANYWRQQGFVFALSTIGWIILITSSIVFVGGDELGILSLEALEGVYYGFLILSGVLIFFFSDPKINVFARVGKGVWDSYNMVTGVFGDLLSYIRLFAIGISTAILGFVINEIAITFGNIPYVGPLVFVIILIVGHVGNLLISSLGSFVHPMRLIFVEFYKNAGFEGGGKRYKPFSK